MKTLNLYFKFQFTSLSPDAQPISLGIVSNEDGPDNWLIHPKEFERLNLNKDDYELVTKPGGTGYMKKVIFESKSFYAEFSDFDINRCDDWVKENVVSKLYLKEKFKKDARHTNGNNWECFGNTEALKFHLLEWLKQFSDYQIQFICDCGTWDWYWLVQLLGEWDNTENKEGFIGQCPTCGQEGILNYRTGLPKLPDNISPVPSDLNDLIAFKRTYTANQAFCLNREALAFGKDEYKLRKTELDSKKHNALFDAKVIKEIYQKLK